MKNNKITETQYDVKVTALPKDVLIEENVYIPMRDGKKIAVNVFRPKDGDRHPVIMAASPYGKDDFNAIEIFKYVPGSQIGNIAISDHVSFEAPDPGYWVPRGFVVVQIDVRGQGASEGDTLLLGPDEQQDYVELINWAAKADWSNGNIGLLGVSYLAISQWAVAQHRPEALKAIVPWEGFNDFYLRNFFGGIPETGFWNWVISDWVVPKHNTDYALISPPPASEHPLKDEFWQAISPKLEEINAPALICASFSDQGLHSRDSFKAFERISSDKKWMYSHRQPKWHAFYSDVGLEMQERFLRHFLEHPSDELPKVPNVIFEINEDRKTFTTHEADTWPIPGTQYTPYYLHNDVLSETLPTQGQAIYSSENGENALFSITFAEDTKVVGHSKLKLWVEAEDADDMDLFVGIRKFDADGNEVHFYGFGGTNPNDIVARGFIRVSHRELDEAASTAWQPIHRHQEKQLLSKNDIVPVEIEIFPSATLFRAGETLQLEVSGSQIQPDSALLKFEPNNRGRHIIHYGGPYDSHLLIPTLS